MWWSNRTGLKSFLNYCHNPHFWQLHKKVCFCNSFITFVRMSTYLGTSAIFVACQVTSLEKKRRQKYFLQKFALELSRECKNPIEKLLRFWVQGILFQSKVVISTKVLMNLDVALRQNSVFNKPLFLFSVCNHTITGSYK